ncbi:ParA family protein [Pseudomonas syringae]|uniref:ParA family protein n=1 Tax=Pseudomonas syringae TaxID=317 RepID=UPI00200B4A7A|nr:ParA family protein [Pseudomonas syringae]MCK9709849.1 ParA family protein [Pseudomonas syringae pv. syringae]
MTFKMKTLANAIQKGGQGKTFSTCHLAFDGAARGLRVVVIDLDPQGNASHTLAQYASGLNSSQMYSSDEALISAVFAGRENSGISLIQKDVGLARIEKMETEDAANALRMHIGHLSEYFDLCLIDTPPFISNLMASALYASDFVMSPVEPEPYSIQGMQLMVSVIQNIRARGNPDLQFLGMFPNRVNYRDERQVANLAGMREAFKDLVMPFDCRQRGSFAEALGDQKPVWDIKKSAARVAAKEVRAMTQYVFEKMEILQ